MYFVFLGRMAPSRRGCRPTRRFPTTRNATRRRWRVLTTRQRTKRTKLRGVRQSAPTRGRRVPARHQRTSSRAAPTMTAPASATASAVTTDVVSSASPPFPRRPVRVCLMHFTSPERLFVCKQDYTKTIQSIFIKLGGKMAHGPLKKPLDFGGNPDHVTLGLGLQLCESITVLRMVGRVTRRLFNSNNFAISAALEDALYWMPL